MQLACTFLYCLLVLAPVTGAPLLQHNTGVLKEHVLNDDGDRKWCMEILCSNGETPLVLCSQTPPFSCSCPIECSVCGDGYFLPASYRSSSMQKCRHMKACSGEGQIIAVHGNVTTDNICGCDTKRGYVPHKSDQFCDCPSGECPLKVQQQVVVERELITMEINPSQSTVVGSALPKSSDGWWFPPWVLPVGCLVLLVSMAFFLCWRCQWHTLFVEAISKVIRRCKKNPNRATPKRTENGDNDAKQPLVEDHENESKTGPENHNRATPERTENGENDAKQPLVEKHESQSKTGSGVDTGLHPEGSTDFKEVLVEHKLHADSGSDQSTSAVEGYADQGLSRRGHSNPVTRGPVHYSPEDYGPGPSRPAHASRVHQGSDETYRKANRSNNVKVTVNVTLATPAQATVTSVVALPSNGGDGTRVVGSESQLKCEVHEAEDGLGCIQPIQETQRETEYKA